MTVIILMIVFSQILICLHTAVCLMKKKNPEEGWCAAHKIAFRKKLGTLTNSGVSNFPPDKKQKNSKVVSRF